MARYTVQGHDQPQPEALDTSVPLVLARTRTDDARTGGSDAAYVHVGLADLTETTERRSTHRPSRVHARRSRHNRASRNLASLVLSQVAAWAVSAFMLVTVPHFLAAADFGILQFGTTFVSYFMLIGALGTSTFLIKTVARDASVLGLYVFNALVMKIALTVSLAAAAILLAHGLGYSHETVLIVEIASLGMLFTLLNDVLRSALQGIERMGAPAAWAVVQAYVGSAVGLAILLHHQGLIAYALAIAAAGVIPVIANAAQLWKRFRGSVRLDFRVWRTLAVGGLPFLLWASVLVIYGTIDIPIIQAMAGNATVGWYALAYAWVSMPAGFSSLVVTAVLPTLSASAHRSSREFTDLANRAIRLVILVGLPASAGIAIVAPDVFRLFHYQAGFQHAVPLIRILALHIPIVGMDMVLGTALIASDKQRQWTVIGCVAAVFNPLVNLAAIPISVHAFHNGAVGASVVTVATEALMMVGALRLRPRGVLDRATLAFIARCGLAVLVMSGVVIAAAGSPLPMKILLAVIAYAGAAVLCRAVSPSDLRSLTLSTTPPHVPPEMQPIVLEDDEPKQLGPRHAIGSRTTSRGDQT